MGIKSLLVKLLKEASLVSVVLKSLQPTSAGAGERTAKRQKADLYVLNLRATLCHGIDLLFFRMFPDLWQDKKNLFPC